MATYEAVRRYVKRRFGLSVADCSIAHVKELSGLEVRRAPNRIGRGRQNPCPQRHRAAIGNALRHFRMISVVFMLIVPGAAGCEGEPNSAAAKELRQRDSARCASHVTREVRAEWREDAYKRCIEGGGWR